MGITVLRKYKMFQKVQKIFLKEGYLCNMTKKNKDVYVFCPILEDITTQRMNKIECSLDASQARKF